MIKKLLFSILIMALMVITTLPLTARADAKLDEIEVYNLTVDMENDGSADITYHIEWKVLDSSIEGPLDWVKIGIPNQYTDNIKALSDNIKDIYYYSDGGDFVRIDLDRSYYAGEIVTLDFSVHQSNMYTLDPGSNLCRFEFTPGWFDGIDVKSMTILWNSENVLDSNAQDTEGNYLKWTAALAAGERYTVSVNYSADAFDTSGFIEGSKNDYPTYSPVYGGQEDFGYSYDDYGYDSGGSGSGIIAVVPVIFIVIFIVAGIIRKLGGGGGYDGGFGTRGGYIGGGHCACVSSCACACAGCACACACAGGGRAGCSAKSFYSPAAKIDKLMNVLQQDLKQPKV